MWFKKTLKQFCGVGAMMMLALFCMQCSGDDFTAVEKGVLVVEAGGGEQTGFFVEFEPVPPGFRKDALQDIIIKNGGLGNLTITSIEIVTDSENYITAKTTIPQTPFSISAEETLPIKFRLAIPAPIEDPEPLTCPELPGGVPEVLQESYCGHVLIKSGPPENTSQIIFFQVNKSTGSIRVSPNVLSFDNPQIGRTITKELTISNESTNGVLTVERITKLDFNGDTSDHFSVNGFPFPLSLQPGDSEVYSVAYTPQSTDGVTGKLQVESDDPANAKVPVTIQTGMGNAAQIDVQPTALVFPAASVGNPQTQEITITNTGSGAALTITNFLITGSDARDAYQVLYDPDNSSNFVPWRNGGVDTIPRQNSKVYQVVYTPTDETSITGNMRISSNASNVPNGDVTVTLSGNEAAPDGLIAPSTIIFDVRPGESAARSFALRNEGLATLDINGFAFSGSLDETEFSISPDPGGTSVAPGGIASFELAYDRLADDVGLDQGSLIIQTNNPVNGGELSINVRNNNQDNAFSPVARIAQDPEGSVVVDTTVSFDGTGSTAESGELTFHLWTLIERPAGSNADLSGINDSTTTLTPDAPGNYRVQLVVGNSLQLEGSAIQEITVTE
jgi:hypothetical protein